MRWIVQAMLLFGTFLAAAMAQPTQVTLPGTAWRAVELYGIAVPAQSAAGDRAPHLVFGVDGRVSGADGCNRLSGPYTVKDESITFGEIAGTQMACPKTEEIARRFRAALQGAGHWRIEYGRLQFYGATGKPLGVFEPAPAGDAAPALEGTTWHLVRFEGGDGRRLTPDDPAKYTIQFAADGAVTARVDCNRGRGTWTVTSPSEIELGPLALTRVKCREDSLDNQIAREWTSVRSFAIKDGHLFLSLAAGGGIYEFAPVARAPRKMS